MADSDWRRVPADFLARLAEPATLWRLFDYLPEVYFFAKDAAGHFVMMNEANLRLHGCQHVEQIVGKTDFDFHPRHLAEQYVREDHRVMQLGRPLPNQVWLVGDADGRLRWFVSSKTPLFDQAGQILGIAGVMRDFERAETLLKPYQEMEHVLTHVLEHYTERLRIESLAQLAKLSISQFDRRFKALFQMTPQQYVLRVRLNAACQALLHGDRSIAAIAAETGFYDQSSFTKQFARHWGLTPRVYRQQYASRKPSADMPRANP